jgi:hypothetical protein
MRTGPHVPDCRHGTPGPVRYECTCAIVIEACRRRGAWLQDRRDAAYVGPSVLRTELANLFRNLAEASRRLETLRGDSDFDPEYEDYYPGEVTILETKQQRRLDRIKQIRATLARQTVHYIARCGRCPSESIVLAEALQHGRFAGPCPNGHGPMPVVSSRRGSLRDGG